MRTRLLVLLFAFAALSPSLGAQGAPSGARPGRVRGIIVDSLLGASLAGASVSIPLAHRTTVSDSAGRFVLDSIPAGNWTIGFHHPALDSIGLSDIESTVRIFAGATSNVELATPSFDAYWVSLCSAASDSLARTVAFGAVHSRLPTHHVKVELVWRGPESDEPTAKPTLQTTPIDDGVRWTSCGIPWGAWVRASARDSLYAADALFRLGPRGIAMHDLAIDSGSTPVHGHVLDDEGRPVEAARVSVVDSPLTAETDAWGQFSLPEVPRATRTLDVRAAGFAPSLVVVEAEETPFVIRLRRLSSNADRLQFGSDRLRLEMRRGREGQQLVEGAALPATRAGLDASLPTGACHWWLDGRPITRDFALAQPVRTLRAVESYARGIDAPAGFEARDCGVVMLWTISADW